MKTKFLMIALCFWGIKATAQSTPDGNACNVINNGNFEGGATCAIIPPSAIAPVGQISTWSNQIGTPDLFILGTCGNDPLTNQFELNTNHTRGCNSTTFLTPPTSVNTHIVGFQKYADPTNQYSEAITQTMLQSFTAGRVYRIKFWAKLGDDMGFYNGGSNTNLSSKVIFYAGSNTNIPPAQNGAGGISLQQQAAIAGLISLASVDINLANYDPTNPWQQYTATFTFTNNATNINRIYISTDVVDANQVGNYTYIDDVSIEETPENIVGSTQLCLGTITSFTNATAGGTWSSSNTAIATVNAVTGLVTAVGTGIATITYTVNNINNYCSVSSTALVVTVAACNPCQVARANASLIGSATIATTINGTQTYNSTQVYKIDQDITFTGNATFANCEVIIAPNVNIFVATGATISIEHCHFYSCTNMWQGITAMQNAAVIIGGYSFIEDAYVAVNMLFPDGTTHAPLTHNPLLSIDRTTFNRNDIAVKIDNYQTDYNANYVFPFYIARSIFTSRNIPFTPGSIVWQTQWQLAMTGSGVVGNFTTAPIPPQSLVSPFISNTLYNDNHFNAYLKIPNPPPPTLPFAPRKPTCGIMLSNIGNFSDPYSGVWLGKKNPYLPVILPDDADASFSINVNLFDNLDIGIDAYSANCNVINSVFQKPHYTCTSKLGIRAMNGNTDPLTDGLPAKTNITVNNLDVLQDPSYMENAFYELAEAIHVDNYTHTDISYNHFSTNQNYNNGFNNGFGVYLQGNCFEATTVSNNTITNVETGIYLSYTDNIVEQMGGWPAQINIIGNNIAPQYGTNAITNQYVNNAIQLEGGYFPDGSSGIIDPLILNCTGNIISNVFYGIHANNWVNKTLNVSNNPIISLLPIPNDPTANSVVKYGVQLSNCSPAPNDPMQPTPTEPNYNLVQLNTITGSNLNHEQVGVYVTGSSLTHVGCNTVNSLRHGFKFTANNPQTKFWDNEIFPTNQFGFTLDNSGIIGMQGHRSNIREKWTCTSNNNWHGTNADWAAAGGHFKTRVQNSVATLSPLVVINNPWSNPNGSGVAQGSGVIFPYQATTPTSIFTGTSTAGKCTHCAIPGPIAPPAEPNSAEMLEEDIADGSIDLGTDEPAQRLYVLQEQLYESLKAQTSIDNSTLQSFMQSNAWGSFDYIYYTQKYLNEENMSVVEALLNYFPNNNVVDENYYKYYDIVKNIKTGNSVALQLPDLCDIAQQCPAKHGKIVFAARALYNQLTHSIHKYNDNCESNNMASRRQPIVNAQQLIANAISIFPNPATTTVNIPVTDAKNIVITNIVGKVVATQECIVGNTVEVINIAALPPGVYIIQIHLQNGTVANSKLIKQ